MGSLIQLAAVVCVVLIVWGLVLAKRKKPTPLAVQRPHPRAIYDRLDYAQLNVMAGQTATPFKTTIQVLFDVADQTSVEGFITKLSEPHIPRGTSRVSMFDGRRIVMCLSEDKRTMLHQEMDSDGRFWLYFMCSTDRTLEESFEILLVRAQNAAQVASGRQAR